MSTIIKERYVFKIVQRGTCIYLWTSCWHNSLVSCRVRCAASIILYCIMKREINFWKLDSIFCNLFAILLIFSICGSGHFYFLSVNYVHCTKLPPPLPESNLNPDVHVLPFVRMKINKTYLHHSFTLLYYLKNIPCLHANSFWMSSAQALLTVFPYSKFLIKCEELISIYYTYICIYLVQGGNSSKDVRSTQLGF